MSDEAVRLAREIAGWEESDANEYPVCVKCRGAFNVDVELEVSPLCDLCAHDASDLLARSVLAREEEIERMRALLVEALWALECFGRAVQEPRAWVSPMEARRAAKATQAVRAAAGKAGA